MPNKFPQPIRMNTQNHHRMKSNAISLSIHLKMRITTSIYNYAKSKYYRNRKMLILRLKSWKLKRKIINKSRQNGYYPEKTQRTDTNTDWYKYYRVVIWHGSKKLNQMTETLTRVKEKQDSTGDLIIDSIFK